MISIQPKRYVEKFVINKKLPNDTFVLITPEGNKEINLYATVHRIYEEKKGNDVKKVLKKAKMRNATIEKALNLFEGFAVGFLLDDYDKEVSKKIKKILEQAIKRKDHLFLEMLEEDQLVYYEVLYSEKQDDTPFRLRHNHTKQVQTFERKEFIEYLLQRHEKIQKVI